MPRTAKNIYKRKDGRWEARYPIGRMKTGKPNMLLYMPEAILKPRNYYWKRRLHKDYNPRKRYYSQKSLKSGCQQLM